MGTIAAAAGSAVGLGNIWRFPYITGENGGAAFIIVYIALIAAIGIPVMIAEFIIGRRAQRNALGSFKALAPGKYWYLIGVMGIIAAFMILAFYSTVAGWTFHYLFLSLTNAFQGESPAQLENTFNSFFTAGWLPVIWQLVVMSVTAIVIIGGVQKGIEKFNKVLMPLLFLFLIVLCVRSVTLPGAEQGLRFLFDPDFSKINAETVLIALGQGFFSMSIGMGTMITYGSYIRKQDRLDTTAFSVGATDTMVAILAGVAIFPAVFAFGIAPSAGEGLAFITLPNIFQQMAGGYYWSVIFFLLLIIASITSTISVLEVVVAFMVEELRVPRRTSTLLAGGSITLLGIFCTLSQGPLPQLRLFGMNLFDLMNFTTANILLPLGGLLIVLFLGWSLGRKNVLDEISNSGRLRARLFPVYMFIIRFLAPVAIAIVFLDGLGIINF